MAQAALLAASMGSYPLILEGDSHIVSLAINHPRLTTDWHINPIISDLQNHLLFFKSRTAPKIIRSANSSAHQVARWATSQQISGIFPTNSLPVSSFRIQSGNDPPSLFPLYCSEKKNGTSNTSDQNQGPWPISVHMVFIWNQ